ncbi:hypothetical protein [Pseudomonas hormoni]|nr:hypothetical protein [Pseudomonas hormoni]
MDDLIQLAHNFRASLELQRNLGLLPRHMADFPRGCCGVTSELLGDYLNSYPSGPEAESVSAYRDGKSHIWLLISSLVVDLTGDQFPDRPAVYVGPVDNWYQSWEVDLRGKAQHCHTPTSHEEHAVLARFLDEFGLPSFD